MAEIIDERQVSEAEENVEFASLEPQYDGASEEVTTPQYEQPQQASPDEYEDIPDKYRGKSAKEIARMHQEAEKMMGRHSQEVGELRAFADSLLKAQLATNKPTAQQQQPAEEVDDVDFYVDPKKAVQKALDSHPAIRQAQEAAVKMQRQESLALLQNKHPDMLQISRTPQFIDWVGKSVVRQNLYRLADQQYDAVAADELLTLWKERASAVETTKNIATEDRRQAMRTAQTGATKASAESVSKKVYRRADLINLLQTNPDRYYAMATEIERAYAEGRVR
jgi:hypothetical protein